jgi:hypothetical protein
MRTDQTVAEMTEEVLLRQAKTRAEQTAESLAEAFEAVPETKPGRQLRELCDGPHRNEKAQEWQEGLAQERAEEQLRYIVRTNTPAKLRVLPAAGRWSVRSDGDFLTRVARR